MSKQTQKTAAEQTDDDIAQSAITDQKTELAAKDSPASPAPSAETKTAEQLQQELADAKATITELSKKREEADAFELAVREKMKAGLTREQAGAVILRQHEWDRSDLGRMQNARHARRQVGN